MDKKNYVMIGLSIVLLVSLGFNIMPEPTHQCDSRELKAYCFDLSSTGKTCYTLPNYSGAKRCTEGWKEIYREIIITKHLYKQYLCDTKECNLII